jgi:hypothetical protein
MGGGGGSVYLLQLVLNCCGSQESKVALNLLCYSVHLRSPVHQGSLCLIVPRRPVLVFSLPDVPAIPVLISPPWSPQYSQMMEAHTPHPGLRISERSSEKLMICSVETPGVPVMIWAHGFQDVAMGFKTIVAYQALDVHLGFSDTPPLDSACTNTQLA